MVEPGIKTEILELWSKTQERINTTPRKRPGSRTRKHKINTNKIKSQAQIGVKIGVKVFLIKKIKSWGLKKKVKQEIFFFQNAVLILIPVPSLLGVTRRVVQRSRSQTQILNNSDSKTAKVYNTKSHFLKSATEKQS